MAIVVAALALVASATNAAPPECPAAFEVKPLSFFVDEFGGDISVVEVIDANQNDLLCFILLPDHSPNSPIFVNAIDDVAFAKKP
ncbi:MAG TPA: hypothetical protein VFL61_00285 [Gaiellaceae bacterium]|nr:hypothetical protein [Gaiellaceae bacterium]